MATGRALGETFSRYVGEQIRGEAAIRGLSVTGLGRAMRIERVTLTRYLTGVRSIPLPVLYDAAIALGMSAGVIVERAEDRMAAELDFVLAARDDDDDAAAEANAEGGY